jgi:hypothetical protein
MAAFLGVVLIIATLFPLGTVGVQSMSAAGQPWPATKKLAMLLALLVLANYAWLVFATLRTSVYVVTGRYMFMNVAALIFLLFYLFSEGISRRYTSMVAAGLLVFSSLAVYTHFRQVLG